MQEDERDHLLLTILEPEDRAKIEAVVDEIAPAKFRPMAQRRYAPPPVRSICAARRCQTTRS